LKKRLKKLRAKIIGINELRDIIANNSDEIKNQISTNYREILRLKSSLNYLLELMEIDDKNAVEENVTSELISPIGSDDTAKGRPDFDYLNYPTKINVGCGFDIREGYLNVDFQPFHNPDLVADIRNLNMLPSDYYDEIIAQDCLEHLKRTETQDVLLEWSRLLKPGGILILRIPNILGLLKLFTWDEYKNIEKQQTLIQCIFGTQAYNGDYHYTCFTELLIRYYLENAGLTVTSMIPKDEWLLDITATKV